MTRGNLLGGLPEEQTDNFSDEELLALSIERPSIFSIIVGRYQEAFLRKARQILGNRQEIEDVVQDTFTKIYLNAAKFKTVEGASFKSWAYKILINTTFTQYKKLKRGEEFVTLLDQDILVLIGGEDAAYEKLALKDQVVSVLALMPQTLAKVLKMQFIEDKSQEEIAEIEGISISAVKTRVHRAKKEFSKISRKKENK